MPVQMTVTNVIDRPVDQVFHFYADEHVRNHPRWDPDIQLSLDQEAPIGVGTVIQRVNRRSGTPVAGTMEVTEFEPGRVMGVIIRDGPMVMRSRATFEALSERQTLITTFLELDLPSMDESGRAFLLSRMERSGKNMKALMETEL